MYLCNGPYLQDAKKNSIVIMWEMDEECACCVRIYKALDPQLPMSPNPVEKDFTVYHSAASMLHKITVYNLQCGCDYCYEILTDSGIGLTGRIPFRTAPDEETPFSFLLTSEHGGVGDPFGPYTNPIINLMKREHADIVVSLGDIVRDGRIKAEWSTYLFTPYRDILRSTPFYPCVGNHEVGANAVSDDDLCRYENFNRYFAFPHYYSFDYGCAHFCVLDAPFMFQSIERDEEGQDAYVPRLKDNFMENEQVKFLKADLSTTEKTWKFVVFHYPPYTSSHYDVRALRCLTPIFEEHSVDIVFNSHAIVYERSHPITAGKVSKDGVRYILTGGFGKFDHWFRSKSNGLSAKLSGDRPNYVRVALTPYHLELQAIDWEGKLFDTMQIDKI